MHHVVALIAERQKGTCTNRSLSRLPSPLVGRGTIYFLEMLKESFYGRGGGFDFLFFIKY
ncbi:hypothetical protein Hanom_Chr11g00977721 [Helianthus anomalus]